jgi:hypothetical protein
MRNDPEDPIERELQALRTRLEQLEIAVSTGRQSQEGQEGARAAATVPVFRSGDRVRIKNKVRKPATWSKSDEWNQRLAQKATVTHRYREQVHFITDNGVKTWRAENNLEAIN